MSAGQPVKVTGASMASAADAGSGSAPPGGENELVTVKLTVPGPVNVAPAPLGEHVTGPLVGPHE